MAFQHYQSHSCVPVVCTGFAQGSKKNKTAEPFYNAQGSMYSILSIDTTSFFLHHLRALSAKECQSFTNHGHDKTPPTVFNLLSLWLTLPRDMGVSHTLWPHSITRAILACLWFAQGLHKAQKKSKQQSRSMMFRVILCIQLYRLMQLVFQRY